MPSGSKKRKANKKNRKGETSPANPNSQALHPLPLHQHQGNGHASATDEDGEEEEEVFETPRSQPPDPVDAPHSGDGSSPRVPLDEVPEQEVVFVVDVGSVGAAEENPVRPEGIVAGEEEPARAVVVDEPVKEDSTRFYEAGGENLPASSWQSTREDEGLAEMVMDESAREDLNIAENHKVLVQEVNTVNVNGEAKEMAQVDNNLNETENSSDRLVEVGVGITEADTGNVLYKDDSAAESPEVLIKKVDAYVSHGKEEVKIVPLQEEETSSGDGDLDFEADRSEAMRAEGLDGVAMVKSTTDSTKVDTFDVEEAKEIPRIDDGSKETNSDRLAKEKHMPIEIPVSEESLVGGVVTENHEILVDEVDSTSPPQESGEPSANAARTENVQRSEVARGPLVVRRATLWNCCGLLDVFTGSQR